MVIAKSNQRAMPVNFMLPHAHGREQKAIAKYFIGMSDLNSLIATRVHGEEVQHFLQLFRRGVRTIEQQFAPDSQPYVASLAEVPRRPYAALDYLWLVEKNAWITSYLTTGCQYRHRFAEVFHERQKQLIRVVNAMNNHNQLRSDYPGDTTQALIVGSGARAAQIDHVYPYARFGGNLFSNALLASGAFNNRMGSAAPAAKWGAVPQLALYDTQRHT